jgi:hypothetical protein
MWDGPAVDMPENMKIADELIEKSLAARTLLEIEIGVVGGEEDGVEAKHDAKLYSTPEDALMTVKTLGMGERGRYMVAATLQARKRCLATKDFEDAAGSCFKGKRIACWKQANGSCIPRWFWITAHRDS